MKIEFYVHIGQGNPVKEVVHFPNGLTDKQIEEEFQEWKAGIVDASWTRLDESQKQDDRPMRLTNRQLDTPNQVQAETVPGKWRYPVPPASRFNGSHLSQLSKKGLLETVSCPLYHSRKKGFSGKGIQLTPAGTQYVNLLAQQT